MGAEASLLYHYTSSKGLKGILSSRKIWATDILYLNDSAEINYSLELIKSLMKEKWSAVSRIEPFYFSFEYLLSSLDSLEVFITAFSGVGDQLSQWRGYTLPTGGFSIGFDKTKMENYFELNGIEFCSCIYEVNEQRKLLGELLDSFIESIGKITPKNSKSADMENAIHRKAIDFYIEIMRLAPRIKNPSFSEEIERRLVLRGLSHQWSEVQYRIVGSMLVPYVEVGPIDQDCFSKIIIGPCQQKVLSLESVKRFVQSALDREIEVITSEIPYRIW